LSTASSNLAALVERQLAHPCHAAAPAKFGRDGLENAPQLGRSERKWQAPGMNLARIAFCPLPLHFAREVLVDYERCGGFLRLYTSPIPAQGMPFRADLPVALAWAGETDVNYMITLVLTEFSEPPGGPQRQFALQP
jgi:hypothetical protein